MNKIHYVEQQPITKPHIYYYKNSKLNWWQLLELPFLVAIKTLLGQTFCDWGLSKHQENKIVGYKTINLDYNQDLLQEIKIQALKYYNTTGNEATHVIIGHDKYRELMYSLNINYAFRYLDYRVNSFSRIYNLKLVICPFIEGAIVLGDSELK